MSGRLPTEEVQRRGRPRLGGPSAGTGWWLARRLLQVLVTILIVVFVAFIMLHSLPGDPAVTILGVHATPASLSALRAELHLDDPLFSQLARYFWNLIHGDLGQSIAQPGQSVSSLVLPALGVTVWIVAATILLSAALAIPIGVLAGWTRRKGLDFAIRAWTMILVSIPPFVVGLILLLVVALRFHAAPTGGWAGSFLGDWAYLWLPTLAMTAHLLPTLVLVVRERAVEVTSEPFIEAALSRGVPHGRVVINHVVRNSITPLITVAGLNIGSLISFAVVVETIFSLPGLGSLLLESVFARDYPIVQAVVIVTAIVTILGNFFADYVYRLVDKRAVAS